MMARLLLCMLDQPYPCTNLDCFIKSIIGERKIEKKIEREMREGESGRMGKDEEKSLKILYNCNTLLDLVLFIFLRALVLIFQGVVIKRY